MKGILDIWRFRKEISVPREGYFIYRFIDAEGDVIYVGRTKDFFRRMREHFTDYGHLTDECYKRVQKVDYIVLNTYNDMRIKEIYYIAKYDPEFNQEFKGDVTLVISGEADVWNRAVEFNLTVLDVKEKEVAKTLDALSSRENLVCKDDLAHVYTPLIYNVMKKKRTNAREKDLLQMFKEKVGASRFNCLKGIVSIVDYETSCLVVQRVTKRANVNRFKYRIEALAYIGYYEVVARTNVTKKVYTELLKHVGGTYTKEEQKQIVSNVVKKVRTAKQSDVQHIFNTFFIQTPGERIGNERTKQISHLTIEAVANEFNVDKERILDAVKIIARGEK